MDFSAFMNGMVSYAQSHPLVVILLALCFLWLVYRRPKFYLSVLLLGVFLLGVYYMITSLAGSGSQHKSSLIQEQKQSEE